MKAENLIAKIKKAVCLGVAGLVGVVSLSCQMTPQEAQALGILGAMTQVSPYATPGQRVLGAGLGTAAQMSHDMNVAREGRSEVNVYGGDVGRENQEEAVSIPNELLGEFVITCNSWFDFNNDDKVQYNELKGVKDVFEEIEPIVTIVHVRNSYGKKLRCEAKYNPKLSSALSQMILGGFRTKTFTVREKIPSNDYIHSLHHDVGGGTFKFSFFVEDRFIGSSLYEVK
jgi:hypothetical protein